MVEKTIKVSYFDKIFVLILTWGLLCAIIHHVKGEVMEKTHIEQLKELQKIAEDLKENYFLLLVGDNIKYMKENGENFEQQMRGMIYRRALNKAFLDKVQQLVTPLWEGKIKTYEEKQKLARELYMCGKDYGHVSGQFGSEGGEFFREYKESRTEEDYIKMEIGCSKFFCKCVQESFEYADGLTQDSDKKQKIAHFKFMSHYCDYDEIAQGVKAGCDGLGVNLGEEGLSLRIGSLCACLRSLPKKLEEEDSFGEELRKLTESLKTDSKDAKIK